MQTIQNDTLDAMARDLNPLIVSLTEKHLSLLTPSQQQSAQNALVLIHNWHGDMSEESVAATVHAQWQLTFYTTLLKE